MARLLAHSAGDPWRLVPGLTTFNLCALRLAVAISWPELRQPTAQR